MIALGNFFFKYRSLIFIAMAAVLFLPTRPVFGNAQAAMWAGLVIALAGQLLRFITIGYDYIVRGGRNRRVFAEGLVTGGMFAHCRNPMYVGNVLLVLGTGLVANSAPFLFFIFPAIVFIYQAIILAEENYLKYCAQASRWIPDFRNFSDTVKNKPFLWERVLLKDHGTTFFLMTVLFVLIEKRIFTTDAARFYNLLPVSILLGILIISFYITIRILKKWKIWTNA
jgi:protein-S-isoprenylcysteine O-methyltransferase Ste14